MAQLRIPSIFYMLGILISSIIHNTTSYHSLSSQTILHERDSYTRRDLIEEAICHPLHSKKEPIKLKPTWNSAVIIQPAHMFDRWVNRTSDLICKFVVKAPKGEHLMAVIQTIAFRRIGNECLDYVKFRRKDRHPTEKFCGHFDQRIANSPVNDYSMGQNDVDRQYNSYGEFDLEGEIETTIFVSQKSLRPDEMPLNITIVYTPYKDCNRVSRDHKINLYRSLERYDVCVAEDYFCDGLQNCIVDICLDEKDCPTGVFSNGTGTKVTIATVSTILLCFIIFLMGLWFCRRHKKLCWSADCAGPSSNSDRFAHTDRDSANSGNQSVPSAPMLQVSVLSTALDKDLPPSYDSLFPEHANPSAT